MPSPHSSRELLAPTCEAELLTWLLATLSPMNRTRVKQLLRSGRVTVNGASVTRHDHLLRPGDRISISREAPASLGAELAGSTIVFEDDSLLVIDKPAGLLTVATESEKTDTAFARLRDQMAKRRTGRPFVVHRLDRETSGLLLFAKSPAVRDSLQANWDSVTKQYFAIVEGIPRPNEGEIENFLTEGRDLRVRASNHTGKDAKRARSLYKVVASNSRYSLVEVTLETGRKHQIRVHMEGLGCPVAGDKVYGAATDPAGRLCLHAWRMAFDHPGTGKRVELESQLPEKLRRIAE
jgi:23S rRNA pseudouridine1911/1915/1917 synthase